jgi:hypothetical protein
VSGIATGHPLASPTLLVCLYLNPHHHASGNTREVTISIAEEDISDFLATTGTRNGDIIIGGDLNVNADEIEEEVVNGSWLFECILGLNRSHNATTSHHRDGNREIDFIFSGIPLENVQLTIPNIRDLSDHDPICVQMQATQVKTEAYIRDCEFARKLFNEIFDSSNPTPQEHLRRLQEEEAQGRSAIKIVNLEENWQRDINLNRLQLEGDPSHDQRLMENFRR